MAKPSLWPAMLQVHIGKILPVIPAPPTVAEKPLLNNLPTGAAARNTLQGAAMLAPLTLCAAYRSSEVPSAPRARRKS
jgi:hypothetical protein